MPLTLEEQLENVRRFRRESSQAASEPYEWNAIPTYRGSGLAIYREAEREYRVAKAYWDSLPTKWQREICQYADRLPPMSERCRLVVQIPARFEEQYLERTLRLLTNQVDSTGSPIHYEMLEVLVVSNRPMSLPADSSVEVAASVARTTEIPVYCLDVAFEDDEPFPLTLSRRYAADISVLRMLRRGPQADAYGCLYFALEDADLAWADPRQFWFHMRALDEMPWVDATRGVQDRCPWIIGASGLLMIIRRSWNFTENYLFQPRVSPQRNPDFDFNWSRVVTSGWNTMITMEAFCSIGGYTPNRRMGEDVGLGERISCLRGAWHGKNFVPETRSIVSLPVRAEGSPRRWIQRLTSGIEPYSGDDNHKNFFGPEIVNTIRKRVSEFLPRTPWDSLRGAGDLLEDALSQDWEFVRGVWGSNLAAAERHWRRVMVSLGFRALDWRFNGSMIRVQDVTHVEELLQSFRRRTLGFVPHYAVGDSCVGRRPTWRGFARRSEDSQ
jgi:hypothetical protein